MFFFTNTSILQRGYVENLEKNKYIISDLLQSKIFPCRPVLFTLFQEVIQEIETQLKLSIHPEQQKRIWRKITRFNTIILKQCIINILCQQVFDSFTPIQIGEMAEKLKKKKSLHEIKGGDHLMQEIVKQLETISEKVLKKLHSISYHMSYGIVDRLFEEGFESLDP